MGRPGFRGGRGADRIGWLELVGKALVGKRDKVLIGTKFGNVGMGGGVLEQAASSMSVARATTRFMVSPPTCRG